jgi:HAD superfamily hydrolase (TIGR01549 family)
LSKSSKKLHQWQHHKEEKENGCFWSNGSTSKLWVDSLITKTIEHRLRTIQWIIFDFFWTLYRITPTPIALAQRFLKQLKAPLSQNPIEIVRRFAIADGYLYRGINGKPVPAASIRKLGEITQQNIQSFFSTDEWQKIENEIAVFISERHLRKQPKTIQNMFILWHQYWRKPKRQARMIPETFPVLSQLAKQQYNLVVASNSPWDLMPILTRDHLSGVIKKVVTYKDTGYQKPSINFFRSMIQQIPAPIEQICFVGDSINNDIEPAKTLGVLPILVWRTSQHRQPPPKLKDVITINRLQELLTIFS